MRDELPRSRGAHAEVDEPERHLPYPSGWFCLARSRELAPGRVVTRRFMNEDIVLYRTRDGRPRAVRPYCPHLGAHLGAGGTVEGQNLVCPAWSTDVHTYAQEIIENTLDYRHLPILHHVAVQELDSPTAQGPLLHMRLRLGQDRPPALKQKIQADHTFL
ncbi:Rieske 2Fe-2S domain-containing protein [Streptomyces sp. NY05-11A]|uniref:Rieske 2Fe-2S domain-containing protein n=1 Tax=Streptomyces soliscabiei TaxID=588897 RepID=UPI0039F6724B